MYNAEGLSGTVGKITDLDVQYYDIYQYIVYLGMNTIKTQATFSGVTFCFMDERKKAMKGTYLTPSHKPLLQKGQTTFNADDEEVLYSIYDLLKKYNSNIQIIKNGDVIDR